MLESLVVISLLESGGPLVLKLMSYIVMDLDNSGIRALAENLQILQMKDIPGKNFGTVVSYLKGVLFLLANCGKLPTDSMGILRDTFCLSECDEFTGFMTDMYFEHKRKTNVFDYMEYLTLAKAKYRTLYRKQEWTVAKSDPSFEFYVGKPETEEDDAPDSEKKETPPTQQKRGWPWVWWWP